MGNSVSSEARTCTLASCSVKWGSEQQPHRNVDPAPKPESPGSDQLCYPQSHDQLHDFSAPRLPHWHLSHWAVRRTNCINWAGILFFGRNYFSKECFFRWINEQNSARLKNKTALMASRLKNKMPTWCWGMDIVCPPKICMLEVWSPV